MLSKASDAKQTSCFVLCKNPEKLAMRGNIPFFSPVRPPVLLCPLRHEEVPGRKAVDNVQ